MKQISSICLMRLTNGEHHQFHSVIIDALNRTSVLMSNSDMFGVVSRYSENLQLQEAAMGKTRGSDRTLEVVQANRQRNQLDASFRLKVKSAMLEMDPLVREAGTRIMFILNKYGDVKQLSYDKKSSMMTVRNNEISETLKADLKTIGGEALFSDIARCNAEFTMSLSARGAEKVNAIQQKKVTETRLALDTDYRELVLNINAYAVFNTLHEYDAIIDQVNYQITYFRQLVSNRMARLAAEKKKEPLIPKEE